MKLALVLISIIGLMVSSCGASNTEWVKERACAKWEKQGFECVDYEGFKWSLGVGRYGRGAVWHRLRKVPDNGITYSGHIERWGDELHVYGPNPADGQTLNHQ